MGETYIVAALYAAITFGFILMNDSAVVENIKDALKRCARVVYELSSVASALCKLKDSCLVYITN